ncbi:hypothetical protein GPALN_005809 [Globodera pallida]|nr:hypothetical protein GPALN_005809 [Globodera pallida]
MNMLLLLVSAVILPIMPRPKREVAQFLPSQTIVFPQTPKIILQDGEGLEGLVWSKSSDPKKRLAAVSRIRGFLSASSNPDELPIAEFVSIGVLPVLVNCLKSSDAKLLVQAAWALKIIACRKSLAIVEAGAVPVLVKLLQYPNNELRKDIGWALTNITAASPDFALAVVEAGALPPLVELLQSINTDTDLCENTAWTLKNIAAASADLALAVIEAGALPPLVELLQSINTDLCEEASLAIGKIIEKFPDLNGCCIDVEHIQIMANNSQKREKVIELIEKCGGLQKIKQLKTEESEFILKMIEKLRLTNGCVVCFNKKIEIAFIPCWHACVCEECAEKIGICPMCRQIISHKQRIYLP